MINQYFDHFIDDLKTTHGDNLVSVILYGSAAAGDFVPFRSDYNVLVALERITPYDLRNAHACMREWTKLGHPVPVYFTVKELEKAGDVFPIEFHFMERARRVLYGRDVLEGLEISDKNLRHQVEYELRSSFAKLRRKYIDASTSSARLVELMAASLTSFAAVFRALLLLRGVEPPVEKDEIMERIVGTLGIEGEAFEKILDIRENEDYLKMDVLAANELFERYLEQIEGVIDSVDALGEIVADGQRG